MRRILALVAGLGLLGGCVQPPLDAEVGPGSEPVTARAATAMFQNVCVDTAPDFAAAPGRLTALQFRPHPRTGTFYHDRMNLSFKVFTQDGHRICSIVFAPRDDLRQTARMLAASGRGLAVAVSPYEHGNAVYMNAKLIFAPR